MATQKSESEILQLQKEVEYWSSLIQQHKQPSKSTKYQHTNNATIRDSGRYHHAKSNHTPIPSKYHTNHKPSSQTYTGHSSRSWVKQDITNYRPESNQLSSRKSISDIPNSISSKASFNDVLHRASSKRQVVLPSASKQVSRSVIAPKTKQNSTVSQKKLAEKCKQSSTQGSQTMLKVALNSSHPSESSNIKCTQNPGEVIQRLTLQKRTVLPPKTNSDSTFKPNIIKDVSLEKSTKNELTTVVATCRKSSSSTSANTSSCRVTNQKYKWIKSSTVTGTSQTSSQSDAASSTSDPTSRNVISNNKLSVNKRKVLPPKSSRSHTQHGSQCSTSVSKPCQDNCSEVVTVKSRYKLAKSPVKSSRTVRLPNTSSVQCLSKKLSGDAKSGKSQYRLVKTRSPAALKWQKKTPQPATVSMGNKQGGHLTWKRSNQATSLSKNQTPPKLNQSIKMKSRYKLVKKAIQISNKRRSVPNTSDTNVSTSARYVTKYGRKSTGRNLKKRQHAKEWTKKYSLKRDNSGSPVKPLSINQAMGRKVINLSSNKFKFIKPQPRTRLNKRFGQRINARRNVVSKNTRSIDRRKFRNHSLSGNKSSNTINIQGVLYRTSRSRLKLVKSLSDIPTKSRFAIVCSSGAVKHSTIHRIMDRANKVEQKREIASHLLQRSIVVAQVARYKKVNKPSNGSKYCLYFNRFGRCHRGKNCKNVHDPKRVAVCTRFLRGRCEVTNCPFSHVVSKEKMPVCQYFLRGVCNRDNCPYLHSNVNKDAEVCQDFVHGFCALGDQCKKKHAVLCPEFARTGKCTLGAKCQLKHIKRATRKRKNSSKSESSPVKMSRIQVPHSSAEDLDDISLPLKDRTLPSYISLEDTSIEINDGNIPSTPNETFSGGSTLHIRPRFLKSD